MYFDNLNLDEFKNIPLLRMYENNHGGLPFFIRKYSLNQNSTPLHRHEYMQINYVTRGKGKHYINKKYFSVIKGDVFVIPPYIPHSIQDDDSNMEVFEFEFIPEFINQSFNDLDNASAFLDFAYIEPFLVSENLISPRLNLVGWAQIEVENILNEALLEYNQRNSGFILLIKSILLKLLVIVGREYTKSLQGTESQVLILRHRDAIFKALEFITENYNMPLGIEEVARKAMLSQSYFSYLFKSITSKTFIEYLNSLRVIKAMELLKTTDKKVLDICYDVGFNNVNHFNRVFRYTVGKTPLEYRKA